MVSWARRSRVTGDGWSIGDNAPRRSGTRWLTWVGSGRWMSGEGQVPTKFDEDARVVSSRPRKRLAAGGLWVRAP